MFPILSSALAWCGCTNEVDDVFDRNATGRIEATMEECDKVLQSSEWGWRFDYTPANGPMTSYVMRFEGGRVSMEDADGKKSESTYKIANAEGPVLSFDTYSILHDLADPGEYPLGTGKGGEFEFIVCRVTEDTLYVRGRKSGNDFKFSRATEGEIHHVRLETSMDIDGGRDISFFHTLKAGEQDAATLFLGQDKRSLDVMTAHGQTVNVPVLFTEEGFRLAFPVTIGGMQVTAMQWDNMRKAFVTADGSVVLAEASTSPFDLGNTVEELMSAPYYTMDGASAPATLQLAGFVNNFPEWQRTEFFFDASIRVDTLEYRVDTQEQVTETGRQESRRTLSAMSFVVNNQYGLPEWGNFTIKRAEVKDADEVTFVEGIRDGAPANQLNRNMYCKKIKGILFDTKGVTVAKRKGAFYIVSSSDSKMWIVIRAGELPLPGQVIPVLVRQ